MDTSKDQLSNEVDAILRKPWLGGRTKIDIITDPQSNETDRYNRTWELVHEALRRGIEIGCR